MPPQEQMAEKAVVAQAAPERQNSLVWNAYESQNYNLVHKTNDTSAGAEQHAKVLDFSASPYPSEPCDACSYVPGKSASTEWQQKNEEQAHKGLTVDENGQYTTARGDTLSNIALRELHSEGATDVSQHAILTEEHKIMDANRNIYSEDNCHGDGVQVRVKLKIPGVGESQPSGEQTAMHAPPPSEIHTGSHGSPPEQMATNSASEQTAGSIPAPEHTATLFAAAAGDVSNRPAPEQAGGGGSASTEASGAVAAINESAGASSEQSLETKTATDQDPQWAKEIQKDLAEAEKSIDDTDQQTWKKVSSIF